MRTGHWACFASKKLCDLPARKEGSPAQLVRADTDRRDIESCARMRKRSSLILSSPCLPRRGQSQEAQKSSKSQPEDKKRRDGLLYSQRK